MLRPDSFALTLLLACCSASGRSLSTCISPAAGHGPAACRPRRCAHHLGLPAGHALGQVFYGPLSDRHGRRPVLIAALGVYLIASVACAVATSIELLIAARFIQALGGSGAVVLARAIVRDIYDGVRVGRELSRLASIMAFAPLVAPLIGGVLQTAFGWRSNFVVLALFGVTASSMVWFLLPETLRQRAPEPVSPASMLRSFRRFLGERTFVVHLGIATCCMAGLFSWISAAAFVLQDIYGLTPLIFGLAFAVGGSGYLIGTTLAARFVARWGGIRTMGFGALAMAAGGLLMVAAVGIGWQVAIGLLVAIGLWMIGMGMTLPLAQAGALLPFPDRAGAAASLGVTPDPAQSLVRC